MESNYVTDRSLWGRLIFDRNQVSGSHQIIEDKQKIMDLIETYHRHWLDGRNEELSDLLDEEIIPKKIININRKIELLFLFSINIKDPATIG